MARPRSFDRDQALNAALRVFWRNGYEGATLEDLTTAMGINRPSLYGTFGNKEQLFQEVLERYATGPAAYVKEALKAPTARQVVENLLWGAVELGTSPKNPGGCLGVHCGLAPNVSDQIRATMVDFRAKSESSLRERLERARAEGDLPPDANAASLARYLTTVIRGMAVEAASGASRKDLEDVVELALRAWPA